MTEEKVVKTMRMSKELIERVEFWQKENEIKSFSAAVSEILVRYLDNENEPKAISKDRLKKYETAIENAKSEQKQNDAFNELYGSDKKQKVTKPDPVNAKHTNIFSFFKRGK